MKVIDPKVNNLSLSHFPTTLTLEDPFLVFYQYNNNNNNGIIAILVVIYITLQIWIANNIA